jgi:hypothetical protein
MEDERERERACQSHINPRLRKLNGLALYRSAGIIKIICFSSWPTRQLEMYALTNHVLLYLIMRSRWGLLLIAPAGRHGHELTVRPRRRYVGVLRELEADRRSPIDNGEIMSAWPTSIRGPSFFIISSSTALPAPTPRYLLPHYISPAH